MTRGEGPQSPDIQSSRTDRQSNDAEIKEATVGYVADFKTLKQLSSSSAAAKAKREQNKLDKALQNSYLDIDEQDEGSANLGQAKEK